MRRKFLYALVALSFLAVAGRREALAQTQTDEHPFEVGGQLTFVGLAPLDTTVTAPTLGTFNVRNLNVTVAGYGARVGYNVNRYVSLEAEYDYLPEKNFNEAAQDRRQQFFAGVKAGKRWEKVGVFAKARPGAMHFDEVPSHTVCGGGGCREVSQTTLAFDAGGVLEYYPTPRTIFRVDAGDTIVHFKEVGPTTNFNTTIFTPRQTTHNFQLSIGLGFRF